MGAVHLFLLASQVLTGHRSGINPILTAISLRGFFAFPAEFFTAGNGGQEVRDEGQTEVQQR